MPATFNRLLENAMLRCHLKLVQFYSIHKLPRNNLLLRLSPCTLQLQAGSNNMNIITEMSIS